jgi:hypothetical protein
LPDDVGVEHRRGIISSPPHSAVPPILEPVEGQPLMIAITYCKRASAERQASFWNQMLQKDGLTDGFAVTVGPRDNGEWPLIWTAV